MLANTPISARKRWPVTIARMVAAGTVSTARVATDRTQRAAAGRRWGKRSKTLNAEVRDMEMLLTRREEPGACRAAAHGRSARPGILWWLVALPVWRAERIGAPRLWPDAPRPGVTGGTWPAAACTGVVSGRVGVLVPGRGGECDRQGGCLARGPEHRDGVGGDVGDAVLALLAGEGQPGVWTDAERGQVVVLTGDHGSGGDRVLVEGVEVESVDVALLVAGAHDHEVVGAAVDESRVGQRDRPHLTVDDIDSLRAEAVRAQVAADGLVPAADVALPVVAGGRECFGVPVDALNGVQGGGGHERLGGDAEEGLDGAFAGVTATDDRGPAHATQRPHTAHARHELTEGEDGGAVGEVLVGGITQSAGVDDPAGEQRGAVGHLD